MIGFILSFLGTEEKGHGHFSLTPAGKDEGSYDNTSLPDMERKG
jgi:hypothetical protein